MCLCFCSTSAASVTHQEHVGKVLVVMRCHFYAVPSLDAATFQGFFACLRSSWAEVGENHWGWSGPEQNSGKQQ